MRSIAAFLTLAVLAAQAQPLPLDQPDMTIDAAVRAGVIDATLSELDRSYVFPEVARRMAEAVKARQKAGEYDAAGSAKAFAAKLTEDLQAVSRDKHLRVQYSAATLPPPGERGRPDPAASAGQARFLRSVNYGFEKVERLERNIAYLELRSFQGVGPEAEAVAAAAMNFVANADALIIDLRRNGGGSPHMVAFVSSYLFDGRTHLNSLHWREGDRTDDFFTRADVPGKRYGGTKPVFVLTSARTFSGAEEFAYNLKNLKRATIVGETTGGGANPGDVRRIHDHFRVFVPTGRAINPITKTNWEGTGVAPDVVVPADQALEKAKELATKGLAGSPPSRG